MATCGCATGRGVVMVDEDPIRVTGTGTPGSPYLIGLEHNGREGCAAVVACLAEHLGEGLIYNPSSDSIQVALSRDEGQGMSFGTDGGLYRAAEGPPPLECPDVTVPIECPTDRLLVGAMRMGGLDNPFNTPWATEACLAQGVDFIHVVVYASRDGQAMLPELRDGTMTPGRSTVFANTNMGDLLASHIRRVQNWSGTVTDPEMFTTGSNSVSRRGGWFGWLAQRAYYWTFSEMLKRVKGNAVVIADCASPNIAQQNLNVNAVMRSVSRFCAADSVLIGVNDPDIARRIYDTGMNAIMVPDSESEVQHGIAEPPWPIEALAPTGVEWVSLDKQYADAAFDAYTDAGYKVLMHRCDRHIERQRAETLGLCGYLSHTPVYTRGPDPFDYRKTVDPTLNRTVGPGMISFETTRGNWAGLTSKGSRGWSTADTGGLHLASTWGGGRNRPAVLAGWACPLPDPNNYVIDFQLRFETMPANIEGKLGLLFGATTDREPHDYGVGSLYESIYPNLYRVYIRRTGEMGIVIAALDGRHYYLRGTDVSESRAGMEVPRLPPPANPAIVVGNWLRFSLTVTPTTITFANLTSGGAVNNSISATHGPSTGEPSGPGPRGPYFWWEKEELSAPFQGQFREVRIL